MSRKAKRTCTPVCTTRTSWSSSTRLRSQRSSSVSLRPCTALPLPVGPQADSRAPDTLLTSVANPAVVVLDLGTGLFREAALVRRLCGLAVVAPEPEGAAVGL